MRFGELFELVITLLIFLVIWILPRIMAARAADRKRRARGMAKGSAKSAAKATPKTASEPKRRWSKEIFSRLIDNSLFETDKKKPPVRTSVPADVQPERMAPEEPAKPVSVFQEEKAETGGEDLRETAPLEQDYQWDRQKRSPADLNPVHPKRRRSSLQKAVIWKELLDPPKALRREPFP